jgi:hypothetical protein
MSPALACAALSHRPTQSAKLQQPVAEEGPNM